MSKSYAICEYILLKLKYHWQVLYLYLDPLNLQEIALFTPKSPLKWNFKYIFPTLLTIGTFFIGNLYLVFWSGKFSKTNLPLTLGTFQTSPRLMSHQAFPKEMWPQIDIAMSIVTAFSVASYLTFLQNHYTVDRYIPEVKGHHQNDLLVVGGIHLSATDSETILSFHNAFHRPAFALFIFLYVFFIGFFHVHVFLINNVFEVTVIEIIFWLLIHPFYIFYLVYSTFTITIFIVLTCKFVQIRQQSMLNRLNKLTKQISVQNKQLTGVDGQMKNKSNRKRSKVDNYHLWLLYEQFNADLLNLCTHIEDTSAFWSAPLTVYISSQIVILCYVAYICLFIDTLPLAIKIMADCIFPNFILLFFAIIKVCARVSALNDRLERANGRFCSQISIFKNSFKNNYRVLMKVCNLLYYFLVLILIFYVHRPNGFKQKIGSHPTLWHFWIITL